MRSLPNIYKVILFIVILYLGITIKFTFFTPGQTARAQDTSEGTQPEPEPLCDYQACVNQHWSTFQDTCGQDQPDCDNGNPDTWGRCKIDDNTINNIGEELGGWCGNVDTTKIDFGTSPDDLDPRTRVQFCTSRQADGGIPRKACSVSGDDYHGHSYTRYVGNDSQNRLYCQRSLCVRDPGDKPEFRPFEFICGAEFLSPGQPKPSKEEQKRIAETGDGKECKTPQNQDGVQFTRFSFTAPDETLYCYRTPCADADTFIQQETGLPTQTEGNLSQNIQSSESRAVSDFTSVLLPETVTQGFPLIAQQLQINPALDKAFATVLQERGGSVAMFIAQSQELHNAFLPKETKPADNESIISKLIHFLGGNAQQVSGQNNATAQAPSQSNVLQATTDQASQLNGEVFSGFYSGDNPQIVCEEKPECLKVLNFCIPFSESINRREKCFETQRYPEGVRPVTGDQKLTPPPAAKP